MNVMMENSVGERTSKTVLPRRQFYLDEWKRMGLRVMIYLTCIDRHHDVCEDGHHRTWE